MPAKGPILEIRGDCKFGHSHCSATAETLPQATVAKMNRAIPLRARTGLPGIGGSLIIVFGKKSHCLANQKGSRQWKKTQCCFPMAHGAKTGGDGVFVGILS